MKRILILEAIGNIELGLYTTVRKLNLEQLRELIDVFKNQRVRMYYAICFFQK